MSDTPAYSISDLFTAEEIDRAFAMYESAKPGTFNKKVTDEIVRPALERINAKTGQENDPSYLGYMLEYVFSQAEPKGPPR
jgi:hypothetical protein